MPKAAACPFSPDLQPPGAGQSGVRPPAQAPGGDTLAALNGALFLGHHQAGRGSQFFPWTPTWKPLPPRPGNKQTQARRRCAGSWRERPLFQACHTPPLPTSAQWKKLLGSPGKWGQKGREPPKEPGPAWVGPTQTLSCVISGKFPDLSEPPFPLVGSGKDEVMFTGQMPLWEGL